MTSITLIFVLLIVVKSQCELIVTSYTTAETPTDQIRKTTSNPLIRNESGTVILQGDIVLTKAQEDQIFSSVTEKEKEAFGNLWTNGVVYKFDERGSGYKMREAFLKAMRSWERNTCINFPDRITNTTEDILFVSEGDPGGYDGCLSYIGKIQGMQMLFLGRSCQTYGQAVHEIGHTLGLYHTLDREDRDYYVNITFMSVAGEIDSRFRDAIEDSNNNFGLPFDYGSVMNYYPPLDKTAMTVNLRNYERTLGSPMVSFVDLFIINERYGCNEKCKSEASANCTNGGFPHPRDCNKCICPGGYGGTLCDKNPDGFFGRVFRASKRWKKIEVAITGIRETMPFLTRTHWISSPNGTTINVELIGISRKIPGTVCDKTGVEIKANEDQRLTGYRFCNELDIGTRVKSKSNFVPVIFYSNERASTTITLRYKYESSEASS